MITADLRYMRGLYMSLKPIAMEAMSEALGKLKGCQCRNLSMDIHDGSTQQVRGVHDFRAWIVDINGLVSGKIYRKALYLIGK